MSPSRVASTVLATALLLAACGGDNKSAESFCDLVTAANADPAVKAFEGDSVPTDADVARVASYYQRFSETGPEKIRSGAKELADFVGGDEFKKAMRLLAGQESDAEPDPEALREIEAVAEKMSSLDPASEALEAAAQSECNVELQL
jgi:hypothetical protein